MLLVACAPAGSSRSVTQPGRGGQRTRSPVRRSGSDQDLMLATTTSTQDSGLLDVLVPLFEKQTGYQVKTISVGTGAALALGARGEADVCWSTRPLEKEWMARQRDDRRLVMHNDFIIVGPRSRSGGHQGHRPGGRRAEEDRRAKAARSSPAATTPAPTRSSCSCGSRPGVEPKGQAWYIESGPGMGQTLTIADQKRAYTISDRAT